MGDAVSVNGVACGAATVTTTDRIHVAIVDAPEPETVVVDLAGGPLAPGATNEGDGSSEIEIEIVGTQGDADVFRVVGSDGPDDLAARLVSVNLNAAEAVYDDDVTVDGPSSLELLGAGGDDALTLDGFGQTAFGRTALLGGPGDDRSSGNLGPNESVIDGGPGRDVVDYSSAAVGLNLVWEQDGAMVWGASAGVDDLAAIETVILTDAIDQVVYMGDATGESVTGPDADTVIVVEAVAGGVPADRRVRGGRGTFDSLEF